MNDLFGFLPNLDIFIVGTSVAAMGIIGATIFFSDTRSITARLFLAFSVVSACWGIINYLSYQNFSNSSILWFARFVIFFATWQAFLFYYLSLTFPHREQNISYRRLSFIYTITIFVSLLTLTPYIFSSIVEDKDLVLGVSQGPLLPIFTLTGLGFVILGVINLVRRRNKAEKKVRLQINFFLLGTIIMFGLILVFNLLLPVIFNNYTYIPFGALFTLPFLASIAYAIMRHKLLDTKVAATEGLTFILLAILLLELLVIEDKIFFYFQLTVFLSVLLFSILLIKSIVWEVSAREQIEKLKVQLERANDDLKQLDEAKSDFVSIASHQLRTPLTVIKGYMSMIDEGSFGPVPEKLKQPITKAYQSSERLEDLVENLLSVSRIERGTMKYNFASTDFVALAKSVVEELSGAAQAKQLALTFKSEMPSLVVEMDEEKIRQIMANLVDNAIKYTPTGGVTVQVNAQDSRGAHYLKQPTVVFTVTDTGDGVPQAIQRELFQKFVRGQNEVHIKGTGLGLYVGRMMVEAHQGQIWVESAGEGKGATFGFAIPLTVPHSQKPSVPKV